MDMKIARRALAAATVLAAGLTGAQAGVISYSSYGFLGDGITVTLPAPVSGGAGQIQLQVSGGKVIDAWCVDLYTYLLGSATFAESPFNAATVAAGLPGVPKTLTNDQIGEIGALVVNGDAIVKANGTADESAAIQIAIWKVEYGSDFAYHPINSNVTSLVATYVGNVGSGHPWGERFGLVALSGSDNQTLVTSVPELSTWAMTIAGFAGLGLAGWRRSRTSRSLA